MTVNVPLDYNDDASSPAYIKDGVCEKYTIDEWQSRYTRLTTTHLLIYRSGHPSTLPVAVTLCTDTVVVIGSDAANDTVTSLLQPQPSPYSLLSPSRTPMSSILPLSTPHNTQDDNDRILTLRNPFSTHTYVLRYSSNDACLDWYTAILNVCKTNTHDDLPQLTATFAKSMQLDADDSQDVEMQRRQSSQRKAAVSLSARRKLSTPEQVEQKENHSADWLGPIHSDDLPLLDEDTIKHQPTQSPAKTVYKPRTCIITTISQQQSYDITKNTVLKQGFLKRLDPKTDKWVQRYYVLRGFHLYSYAQVDDLDSVVDEMHLVGTYVQLCTQKQYSNCFTVLQTYGKKQVHTFQCTTRDDVDDWMYCIRIRHTYAGTVNMPLQLEPQHHQLSMHLNPDNPALTELAQLTATNTMTKVTNIECKAKSSTLIKSRVSKKKRRFVYDGFDLDLVYVTDRIIAMGFPSAGTESIYRNNMDDVKQFLESRHAEHYRIYNLCSERSYDHTHFHDRVVEFPFDDHNCPQFADLVYFCHDVSEWLKQDRRNIVAIHCKAGKGRTGLMICVYLMYLGVWKTATDVLRYYAHVRTLNDKGVTIASQIRYVEMFERYLKNSHMNIALPVSKKIQLKQIHFSADTPKFDSFVIGCHGVIYRSDTLQYLVKQNATDGSYTVVFSGTNILVQNDFSVNFYKHALLGKRKQVFGCWLHTQFIRDYRVKLNKPQIDKVCKQKHVADFTMDLQFGAVDHTVDAQQIDSYGNDPTLAPLVEGRHMTQYNVGADVKTVEVFVSLNEYASEPVLSIVDLQELSPPQLMPVTDVQAVTVGWSDERWTTIVAQRRRASAGGQMLTEQLCLTIVTATATMYLTAVNERQLNSVLDGIRHILHQHSWAVVERQCNASTYLPDPSPPVQTFTETPGVSSDVDDSILNQSAPVITPVVLDTINETPGKQAASKSRMTRRTTSMQDFMINIKTMFSSDSRRGSSLKDVNDAAAAAAFHTT